MGGRSPPLSTGFPCFRHARGRPFAKSYAAIHDVDIECAKPCRAGPANFFPGREIVTTMVAKADQFRARDSSVRKLPAQVRATVLECEKASASPHDKDLDVTEPGQRSTVSQQLVSRPGIH
jgi:hypothetical protein